MAHVSLYRKYRSQTFAEVIGQEHVTITLANAVTENRLHHAYLFTGPRGTGKTSTARILAKSVNCEHGPTATPCNACAQCVAITQGSSIDVIEIDAASHGGVDDVRDLRERVAFAPASARMKVYIVDECHMLSTAGWNAFLKTVEEPPGHVLFVFATTEPHKVLDTILSRTQRFDFKRIAAEPLVAHCADLAAREGWDVEPGALELVVHAGDGSARDSLSVLDQVVAFGGAHITVRDVAEVLGTVAGDVLAELAEGIAAGDVTRLCMLVGRASDAGSDLRQLTRDAVEHLRRLFLVQTAPDAGLVDGTPEQLAALAAQAARIGRVELLRAMDLLAEAMAQMRRGNTRLPLEIALVKAALPEACGDPAALAARMDRLERLGPVTIQEDQPDREAEAPSATTIDLGDADLASPSPKGPDLSIAHGTEAGGQTGGSADLDLVRSSWPAVLEAVKQRSKRLHAFLLPAQPRGLESDVLTVSFGPTSAFHAEQCGSEEWAEPLGAAFDEVLGRSLRLRCVVADDAGEPVTAPEATADADGQVAAVYEAEEAEARGELPDEGEAHERALRTLTRDLGATVVHDA